MPCASDPRDCLMLVRFGDPLVAQSLEIVGAPGRPSQLQGVRLVRLDVRITDEAVTRGALSGVPEPLQRGFYNWDGTGSFDQLRAIGVWHFRQGTAR